MHAKVWVKPTEPRVAATHAQRRKQKRTPRLHARPLTSSHFTGRAIVTRGSKQHSSNPKTNRKHNIPPKKSAQRHHTHKTRVWPSRAATNKPPQQPARRTESAQAHTQTDAHRFPPATFGTDHRQPKRRMEKTSTKQQANNTGDTGYAN